MFISCSLVEVENQPTHWNACPECKGQGKKRRRLRKKVRLAFQKELEQFEKSDKKESAPIKPRGHLEQCSVCKGAGIIQSESPPIVDKETYPHVAIIGGGIGGVALAVACMHRGIPFTLYERDKSFNERSQGYGLTLQQASKAIQGLGLFELKDKVISTRHVVHTTDGKIIGEWGMRKWMKDKEDKSPKKTNMHIARQSLRRELLHQLGASENIKWGYQLTDIQDSKENQKELTFQVEGETIKTKTDLIVGADGIRSTVRKLIIGDQKTPLRYLDCLVVLGICPLSGLQNTKSPLLDSATVFQTANGKERIYMMPYTADSVMWQLSFPIDEREAKNISSKGKEALKAEAIKRTQWHDPIPQIIEATKEELISGYPVYDRELLDAELLKSNDKVTLIGDAAHPMSPFKGQGANQALLDALTLAKGISSGCRPQVDWRKAGIRKSVLNEFEQEMIERSAIKVEGSAEAAKFLHSEIVLHQGDEPRGKVLKRKK